MPLKFSSGRETRLKHSTGADPKRVAKARNRHPKPCYSTVESATIAHFTGRETDYRALSNDTDVAATDKLKEQPAMLQAM